MFFNLESKMMFLDKKIAVVLSQ